METVQRRVGWDYDGWAGNHYGALNWGGERIIRIDLPGSDMCRIYGQELVDWGFDTYLKNRSINDAEKRPDLQALARAAEVIACIALGLDPNEELKWKPLEPGEPRTLWDIRARIVGTRRGRRIDVKQRQLYHSLMIYPRNTFSDYVTADFDALMMVKVYLSKPIPAQNIKGTMMYSGYAQGWLTKDEFLAKHKMAREDGEYPDKLQKGTPYVHQDELRPIPQLRVEMWAPPLPPKDRWSGLIIPETGKNR